MNSEVVAQGGGGGFFGGGGGGGGGFGGNGANATVATETLEDILLGPGGPPLAGASPTGSFLGEPPSLLDRYLNIPRVSITFDSVISPLGSTNANSRKITLSHRLAQQQVRVALDYLLNHSDEILAGKNKFYNEIFGKFYVRNPRENPFLGLYDAVVRVAVLESDPIRSTKKSSNRINSSSTLTVETNIPLTVIRGTENSFTIDVEFAFDDVSDVGDSNPLTRVLRIGQRIFIGDPQLGGEIHTIAEIVDEDTIRLEEPLLQDFRRNNDMMLYHIKSFEERPNPVHFNQVVNTFGAIRDLLDQDTQYNGEFDQVIFDQVFRAGSGAFPGLEEFEIYLQRQADRALRQAGFTNSDSLDHILSIGARRETDSSFPPAALLWTEDNGLRLSNLRIDPETGLIVGDERRPFFDDFLSIFGENGDPNNQFVGSAFLEEMARFAGDFFDSDSLGSLNGVPTALRQWQMIVASFAEHGTDYTQNDVAAIGIMNLQNGLFPEGSGQFLENRDASNFARFADLFKTTSGGKFNPAFIEPWGKRVASNFSPIVPEAPFGNLDTRSQAADLENDPLLSNFNDVSSVVGDTVNTGPFTQ